MIPFAFFESGHALGVSGAGIERRMSASLRFNVHNGSFHIGDHIAVYVQEIAQATESKKQNEQNDFIHKLSSGFLH
ncbi:MAG: hypothetical protein IKM11_04510 [Oscillospiraceae bacterium]|nr:hypothetical protein [Oscillospiraceae bacterium]